jgi:hypothetical protein
VKDGAEFISVNADSLNVVFELLPFCIEFAISQIDSTEVGVEFDSDGVDFVSVSHDFVSDGVDAVRDGAVTDRVNAEIGDDQLKFMVVFSK